MVLHNIQIVQNGSEYYFYTETNIYLGGVCFPCNGQYAYDTEALKIITKALALRWGVGGKSK